MKINIRITSRFSVLVIGYLFLPSVGFAACGSTVQNLSASTSTLSSTAANQCIQNSGTITISGDAIQSYFSNPTIINSGTLIETGASTGVIVIPGAGGGGASSTGGSILNSGTISASGAVDIYGIWLYNNSGLFDSVVNSGNINMANTGQSVGIFNYAGNTITTLTNSGAISVAGGYGAIANNSVVTTLNNSGSISSSGSAHGIVNNSGASIGTLSNTGTIYVPTSGYYGINNSSGASIGTLNNSQGATSSAGVLTYTGVLPTNYNIIINSASSYGQLSGTSVSGSTAFGVNSGTITSKLYTGVLQGLTTSNVGANRSGSYSGLSWSLGLQSGSSTIWDLTFTGGSTADTQQSLVNTASVLQNTFTLQNAVLANSFSYDCNVFGANDICVSAGGRNTAVSAANGLNNTSALLIAAYRVMPSIRIGAYADQNLSVNNSGPTVSLGNNTPLIGLFGAWNERLDGTGTEVKVSAAYGQKNTTVNRQVVGTSEAGSGSSQLNSQGAQVTAKYGFGIVENVIVSPYVGMRYTQNNMNGYTEATSASVTAPLTYSALNTNAATALAGVGASYRFIPQATVFASAGVETDTNTANGSYSATGVTGLTPVNFNANPVKTRPTATLGAAYDVEKNQRIGITGIYRQEAYQATATTTVMATYTVGL